MEHKFIYRHVARCGPLAAGAVFLMIQAGCSSAASSKVGTGVAGVSTGTSGVPPREPSPATRAMMDRLTVPHKYDPGTGFVVAIEPTDLPPALAFGPSLEEAMAQSEKNGLPVVAFATADRCAPCQQFKKDALNDPRVVELLSGLRVIATHVEVDKESEAAGEHLGSVAIPVTYLLRDGKVADSLAGMRSADELLAWLRERGV